MKSSREETIGRLRSVLHDQPEARGVVQKYVANPMDGAVARQLAELIYLHVTDDAAELPSLMRSLSGFFIK